MRQSNKKEIEALVDQKYGTVDADKLSSKLVDESKSDF